MSHSISRSTVYFDSELHDALREKAARSRRSMSELVNDAVRASLLEDEADIAAFDERSGEPLVSLEVLRKDLRRHGKL